MIIIKPQVLVPREELDENKLIRLERCARICYKSEDRMGDTFNPRFLQSILSRGHESVIEHLPQTTM
jgi:thymidylate synthase (FAD)